MLSLFSSTTPVDAYIFHHPQRHGVFVVFSTRSPNGNAFAPSGGNIHYNDNIYLKIILAIITTYLYPVLYVGYSGKRLILSFEIDDVEDIVVVDPKQHSGGGLVIDMNIDGGGAKMVAEIARCAAIPHLGAQELCDAITIPEDELVKELVTRGTIRRKTQRRRKRQVDKANESLEGETEPPRKKLGALVPTPSPMTPSCNKDPPLKESGPVVIASLSIAASDCILMKGSKSDCSRGDEAHDDGELDDMGTLVSSSGLHLSLHDEDGTPLKGSGPMVIAMPDVSSS